MKFFTNVRQYGNNLLIREINNGVRKSYKLKYSPYLFIDDEQNDNPDFTTIFNNPVKKIEFDSIKDAKNFIERYKDLHGFNFYGMNEFVYPFINDTYTNEYDDKFINIVSIDIETMSNDGFPVPEYADKEITVITISSNNEFVVIGNGEYKPHKENVKYINCPDEEILLKTFINELNTMQPDIITGWNIKQFDIPYLVNRISKVLGDNWSKRLSPWEIIQEKILKGNFDKDIQTYDIFGIAVLDYLELYKKWTFVTRETYKLDHIGEVELNEKKLDYSEYGSLHGLYINDYQKYVEYNIRDTELINMLEDKLKLISLVLAISYQAKVNYIDTFSPVKTWDVIIHNLLMSRNTVVPFSKFGVSNNEDFIGGYVKEPIPRMYNWVVSVDLDSLYPHLIMQYNISPEKFKGKLGRNIGRDIDVSYVDIDDMVDGGLSVSSIKNCLLDNNVSICGNKTLWDKNKQGFLPELMETFYAERKSYKKKSIENKKLYEKTHDLRYKKLSVLYDTIQLARKVLLNSAYGALANKYFRWYNIEFAEAITSSGQLVIKYFSKKINQHINKIVDTKGVDYVIANDTDSVVGDSIIYINDKQQTIESFFNDMPNDFIKIDNFNNNYVKKVPSGVNSLSYSNNGIENKPVKYVMKHKVNKELFEITMKNKSVVVTEDHSIIVMEDGELKSIKPKNLNPKKHKIISISANDTDTGVALNAIREVFNKE